MSNICKVIDLNPGFTFWTTALGNGPVFITALKEKESDARVSTGIEFIGNGHDRYDMTVCNIKQHAINNLYEHDTSFFNTRIQPIFWANEWLPFGRARREISSIKPDSCFFTRQDGCSIVVKCRPNMPKEKDLSVNLGKGCLIPALDDDVLVTSSFKVSMA